MKSFLILKRPLWGALLLTLLATGCASGQRAAKGRKAGSKETLLTAQQAADRIEILEATQETWQGGRPQTQGDTEYSIRLRLRKGAPLQFESLWYAGKVMPLHPRAANKGITVLSPNKVFSTDTVLQLHASASSGQQSASKNPQSGQATLTYSSGGKTYRIPLPPFTRLQPPNRP